MSSKKTTNGTTGNGQFSYAINDRMWLVNQPVPNTAPAKASEVPTNHVLVIDCSGSMSGELPRIREQAKRKLQTMVKENDSVSIIWFSGRGQYGALVEGERLSTLADLKDVHAQIDRWLKPIGLTGFKEPLEEVAQLAQRVGRKYPGSVFSLMFMTDGCDNSWSHAEILKAVETASGAVAAAAFVEYGYYADRPLLTKMAEKAGGSLVFAQDFTAYDATVGAVLARRPVGGKRVEVPLGNVDVIGGFAYALRDGDMTTYAVDGGTIAVPEGLGGVWYLSPTAVGEQRKFTDADFARRANGNKEFDEAIAAVYAGVSLFATRMKADVVRPLLKTTGDVRFIQQYANCFGKQAYSEFMGVTKSAAFNASLRWTEGYDPSKVPADDAFTVLDMLKLLSSDDGNRVLLTHPAFQYARTGRKQIDVNSTLTSDEQAEVESLTEQINSTRDPKAVAKLSARIAEISNKPDALVFKENEDKANEGYEISNLVYNETRPNVSIQVRREGTVDLGSRDRPFKDTIPQLFPTFIYRNYTIIRDGLVNVAVLPVRVNGETRRDIAALEAAGRLPKGLVTWDGDVAEVHLTKLPIVNGKMVREVSAKALFTDEYRLTKARAAQKVFNAMLKETGGTKTTGGGGLSYKTQYGDAAAAWLKDQGFTEYSGFNPQRVQAESTDFYMTKELDVKLKGLSSLPSLDDVRERMSGGKKMTASAALMEPWVKEVDAQAETFNPKGKQTEAGEAAFRSWVEQKARAKTREVRDLILDMAKTKFAIVVGQTWPVEFASLDENTLTVEVDGEKIVGTLAMEEKKQTI